MLAISLSVFSILLFAVELWLGMVIIGVSGDEIFVDRREYPGQYWLWMSIHFSACIGLPVLAWFAGI